MPGVVRSANGAPGGMLLKPVEKVWVKAARGGAASGKESLPFAMKSAVEIGAIIFRLAAGVVDGVGCVTGAMGVGTRSAVGSIAATVVAGTAGIADGFGVPGRGSEDRVLGQWDCACSCGRLTDVWQEPSAFHTKLEQRICNLHERFSEVHLLKFKKTISATHIAG